jgi:bilirubin oxidase
MQLVVGSLQGPDNSVRPSQLSLPGRTRLGSASRVRSLSLNEMVSSTVDAPIMAMLGTFSGGEAKALHWSDPITEHPALGATEIWELNNTTEDAHPIHVHLVQFEVVNRQAADGTVRGPEPWETGTKDTVVSLPEEVTRLKARFDQSGLFVWHCHIVDHEDNEMMRPYLIG